MSTTQEGLHRIRRVVTGLAEQLVPTPKGPMSTTATAAVMLNWTIDPGLRLPSDEVWEHYVKILAECSTQGLTREQTAYALATARYELDLGLATIDLNQSEEDGGARSTTAQSTGTPLFIARGYLSIAGHDAYREWSNRLGVDLVAHPDKAASPIVAAKILVTGMMLGTFTGRTLGEFVNSDVVNYDDARQVVNDGDNAAEVSAHAHQIEEQLIQAGPLPDSRAGRALPTLRVQELLNVCGWNTTKDGDLGPQTRSSIGKFQKAWTYDHLVVDQVAGALTSSALIRCADTGGRVSPNFYAREFASRGNGDIVIDRDVILAAEVIRESMGGKPLRIISAYRDPAHNSRIPGAARNSRHVKGDALDISVTYGLTVGRLLQLGVASGIGWQWYRGQKRVRHFDTRAHRTPANPSMWKY